MIGASFFSSSIVMALLLYYLWATLFPADLSALYVMPKIVSPKNFLKRRLRII